MFPFGTPETSENLMFSGEFQKRTLAQYGLTWVISGNVSYSSWQISRKITIDQNQANFAHMKNKILFELRKRFKFK